MEIKLDNDQLHQAMQAAILAAIGETGKAEIIRSVVTHLTKRESGYQGREQPSPLDRIIHDAGEKIAKTILEEQLSGDSELSSKIRALYSEAFEQMFIGERREKLVRHLAEKMGEALDKRDY